MNGQQSLLGMVRIGDPVTSREAAERVAPVRTSLQQDALDAIAAAGSRGLTDGELDLLFPQRRRGTMGKRRQELRDAGLVQALVDRFDEVKRDGRIVWVASQHGLRNARPLDDNPHDRLLNNPQAVQNRRWHELECGCPMSGCEFVGASRHGVEQHLRRKHGAVA